MRKFFLPVVERRFNIADIFVFAVLDRYIPTGYTSWFVVLFPTWCVISWLAEEWLATAKAS
jgi:hypothetical protein